MRWDTQERNRMNGNAIYFYFIAQFVSKALPYILHCKNTNVSTTNNSPTFAPLTVVQNLSPKSVTWSDTCASTQATVHTPVPNVTALSNQAPTWNSTYPSMNKRKSGLSTSAKCPGARSPIFTTAHSGSTSESSTLTSRMNRVATPDRRLSNVWSK